MGKDRETAPGGGDMSGEEKKLLSKVLWWVDLGNSLPVPPLRKALGPLSHPQQLLP